MTALAVLLFSIGIVLVVIELFIPSMGVLGISAGVCFVGSIVVAFGESTFLGVLFLSGTVILVPILLLVGFKIFPHTPIGRMLMLSPPDRSSVNRGEDVSSEPLHDLLGRTGVAATTLRPAGMIEIDGRRVDVVTAGEWIDAGVEVVVFEVEGNRAVVRAVEADGGDRDSEEQ